MGSNHKLPALVDKHTLSSLLMASLRGGGRARRPLRATSLHHVQRCGERACACYRRLAMRGRSVVADDRRSSVFSAATGCREEGYAVRRPAARHKARHRGLRFASGRPMPDHIAFCASLRVKCESRSWLRYLLEC